MFFSSASLSNRSTPVEPLSSIASFADAGFRPISGRSQWPFVTTPLLTENTQFQTIHNIRNGCTGNIHIVWLNPTDTAISFTASVRNGFSGAKERVRKDGSASLTIPAYGKLITDSQTFGASTGEFIYVQSYATITSQMLPSGYASGTYNPESVVVPGAPNANRIEGALRGATDRTMESDSSWNVDMAATANDLFGSFLFGPYAVIGVPTQAEPFITIMGDSKTQNVSADFVGGGRGWVSYGMGAVTGRIFQNLAVSGDALFGFLNALPQHILRRELLDFCGSGDIVINHYATNSMGQGYPAASELSDIATLRALLPTGVLLAQSTCDPVTQKTSGDWATITEPEQEERVAGALAGIQLFNSTLRSNVLPHADLLIDLAAPVESSPGSAKWAPGMTNDGIHQIDAANLLKGAVLASFL